MRPMKSFSRSISWNGTVRALAVLVLLAATAAAGATTIDREPVGAALVRRFGVPSIDAVAEAADGRLYALASDRSAGSSRTPRRF